MDYTRLLKKRLLTPGPTPIPKESELAVMMDLPYHRSESFNSVMMNCAELLKVFFGTKSAPLFLSSSGTGAMEAAVLNLTNPEDKVLVISGGKFGERWAELTNCYGCQVQTLQCPWGTIVQPEQLKTVMEEQGPFKAVFFQAVETSTGVYFPVKEFAEIIRKHSEALVIVDALTSLQAHEMQMDEWGLDCVVSASQKGFGVPPGLSFIALSDRAKESFSQRPRYYFNLETEIQTQAEGQSAWTPPVSLMIALESSLKIFHGIGLSQLYKAHADLSHAVRLSLQAMGFHLFVSQDFAYSLTSFQAPEGVDSKELKTRLSKNYQMDISGGQGVMKGKLLRISHMGFIDPFDVFSALGALDLVLKDLGYESHVGKGVEEFIKNFPL